MTDGEELPADFIGVVVCHIHGEQFHAQVAFAEPNQTASFMDLPTHQQLRTGLLEVRDATGIAVFQPDGRPIPSPRVRAFAGLCRRISDKHRSGLPYSYVLGARFDPKTGRFDGGDSEVPGFTCATFVLEVFDAGGYELLDEEWPEGEEDSEWQEHIIDELNLPDEDPDHAEKLRDFIGEDVRYRPDEVGGAALADDHPANFQTVQPLSQHIRDELTAS